MGSTGSEAVSARKSFLSPLSLSLFLQTGATPTSWGGQLRAGILTSTRMPGLQFSRRNSPPNSFARCRIPPKPTPMLSGRPSITPALIPLPSSRTLTIKSPSRCFSAIQVLRAAEWRKTLFNASWTMRNIAVSNSGANRGNCGGCISSEVEMPLRLVKPSRNQATAELRPTSSSRGGCKRCEMLRTCRRARSSMALASAAASVFSAAEGSP